MTISIRLDVYHHGQDYAAGPTLVDVLAAIAQLQQEISTMSQTLSSEIDASTAALAADFAKLTTGIANLNAELAAALAGMPAGSTVTQAQVAALQGVQASMDTLAASVPQPAPVPVPVPPVA